MALTDGNQPKNTWHVNMPAFVVAVFSSSTYCMWVKLKLKAMTKRENQGRISTTLASVKGNRQRSSLKAVQSVSDLSTEYVWFEYNIRTWWPTSIIHCNTAINALKFKAHISRKCLIRPTVKLKQTNGKTEPCVFGHKQSSTAPIKVICTHFFSSNKTLKSWSSRNGKGWTNS